MGRITETHVAVAIVTVINVKSCRFVTSCKAYNWHITLFNFARDFFSGNLRAVVLSTPWRHRSSDLVGCYTEQSGRRDAAQPLGRLSYWLFRGSERPATDHTRASSAATRPTTEVPNAVSIINELANLCRAVRSMDWEKPGVGVRFLQWR